MIKRILSILKDKRGFIVPALEPFLPIAGKAAAGFGASKLIGGLFDNDVSSNLEGFKSPKFQADPRFNRVQDFLEQFGTGILEGDFGAFSSLAETGSPEFEKVLQQGITDIRRTGEEQRAKAGRARGGLGEEEAVGRFTGNLRFQDFLRAQGGLQNLLTTGANITGGVRGADLTSQGQLNQFNLESSRLELEKLLGLDKQAKEAGEAQGSGIGGIFDLVSKAPSIIKGAKEIGKIFK